MEKGIESDKIEDKKGKGKGRGGGCMFKQYQINNKNGEAVGRKWMDG